MTREEAIAIFKGFKFLPREMKAVDMAIKALEQEPCDDAISRQAVLAIAGDSCLDLDDYGDTKEFCDEIENLPPVTPKQRWIPVSERLPEAAKNVLVTSVGGYVYVTRIVHGEWEYGGVVVAWMPLPKPYEPQAE